MKVKELIKYLESYPNKEQDIVINAYVQGKTEPIAFEPTLRICKDDSHEVILDTGLIKGKMMSNVYFSLKDMEGKKITKVKQINQIFPDASIDIELEEDYIVNIELSNLKENKLKIYKKN